MTGNAPDITRDDIIARARDMVPTLRERAHKTETLRRLPEETDRDFHDAGFYRILQPAAYGGLELDFGTQTELAVELCVGCASSGWVASLTACHAWIFGMFPPEAQDDVWGANPDATISSSFLPLSTRVQRVDGGLKVSGRWGFSSGVDYCAWTFLLMDVDAEEGGGKERVFAAAPLSECTIEDTWRTTGLAGTGSNDIVVDDLFIPAHRVVRVMDLQSGTTPGSAVNPGYLYRLPQHSTFSFNIVGNAIGAARGAVQAVIAELTSRTTVTGAKLAEQASVHLRIAEAEAGIAAAYALVMQNRDEIARDAKAGKMPPVETRARYRRDNAFAAKLCVEAVDRVYPIAGGRGIAADNPVNRAWRDVHAVAHHIGVTWDVHGSASGALAVGQPSLDPRL